MKNNYFKIIIIIIFTSILFTSCGLSTNDLSKKVQTSIEGSSGFKDKGIKIKSLILTKKSGNEYNGVLETTEPNGDFTYSVEVIYDGNNMTWKIVQ